MLTHQVILWDPSPWLIEDILMKFHNLHEDGLKAFFSTQKRKEKKKSTAGSNFNVRNQRESNACSVQAD